jgi:hypothetical protein
MLSFLKFRNKARSNRAFFNLTCFHKITEGDSYVEWFEGSFSDYLEDKKRRLGADSVEPKRVKYRKFTR